jgi:hypothetical protein
MEDGARERDAKPLGSGFSPKHFLGVLSLANLAALALVVKPMKFDIELDRYLVVNWRSGKLIAKVSKMVSRPTVGIVSADGSASGSTHPLPAVFSSPIRPDIVQ